jgi:hypothetical protein
VDTREVGRSTLVAATKGWVLYCSETRTGGPRTAISGTAGTACIRALPSDRKTQFQRMELFYIRRGHMLDWPLPSIGSTRQLKHKLHQEGATFEI